MNVSEAKRLWTLEEENRPLKAMVAKQALDIRMLKAINEKKWWALPRSGIPRGG